MSIRLIYMHTHTRCGICTHTHNPPGHRAKLFELFSLVGSFVPLIKNLKNKKRGEEKNYYADTQEHAE